MKTRVILLLILALGFMSGHSQLKKSRDFIEICIGPSVPVGAFGKTSVHDNTSGYAKTGELLNFTYTRPGRNNVGFSISLRGQRNPIHTKALASDMSEVNFYTTVFASPDPNIDPSLIPYSRYGNWTFEKKSWLIATALAGGYGQLEAGKSERLVLTGRLMIGASYVHAPEVNGKSVSDTAIVTASQTAGSTVSFTVSVSGGIRYTLTKKWHIVVAIEYLGLNQSKFDNIQSTVTFTRYSNGVQTSVGRQVRYGRVAQTVSAVNIHAGVSLEL